VIPEVLALIEKIRINLFNSIEPILPILDGFRGEKGEKTVSIPLPVSLPIVNKELPDLFLRSDEGR